MRLSVLGRKYGTLYLMLLPAMVYLRKVTTQGLNGDGKYEIGLSFQSDTANPLASSRLTYLVGYFGNPWDAISYMTQTRDGKGPLEFAPATEATRKTVEYLHEWYKEGLIDPEIFTQNGQQLKAKSKTTGVGASITFWHLDLNDGDESINTYRVVNMPQNNDGTALWRRNGLMPGFSANQFFITSANKHPKETLQFIDWWLDNGEKALTIRFGPRGYSWDYVGEGKWTELPNIPTGEVRTMANSTLKCPWAYGIPYWCFADFWSQKNITAPPALARQGTFNAKGSYIDNGSVGLPVMTYSESENQEVIEIKTDLFYHVNSSFARFITQGVTDAEWGDYLSKLEGFGMARYVELYNKYYELFNQ